MVKSTEQKLDELLEITEKVPVKKETKVIVPRPKDDEDVSADYKYSRENFYNLVERGQDAIDGILELAKESEHPRTYEVAGQLIKNVADATDKLLDLQKKLKDVNEESKKGPTNVTNALFVGSTSDLSKFLKSQNEDTEKK